MWMRVRLQLRGRLEQRWECCFLPSEGCCKGVSQILQELDQSRRMHIHDGAYRALEHDAIPSCHIFQIILDAEVICTINCQVPDKDQKQRTYGPWRAAGLASSQGQRSDFSWQ